ncbi:MAG: TMEM175 family protein [Thermoplasmata archaeon]
MSGTLPTVASGTPDHTPLPKRPEPSEVEGIDGSGSDMGRIIGLSDGVFAFALTFLAILLILPQSESHPVTLVTLLRDDEGVLASYALSFFIIAIWWGAHHRLFSPIVRYDSLLTRLNNLFLLNVALTPFFVDILSTYGPGVDLSFTNVTNQTRFAVILYAAFEMFAGLILLAIWRHATSNHRLIDPRLTESWIQATERSQFRIVGVFAASIVIAVFSPFLATFAWIFLVFGGAHKRKKLSETLRKPPDPARAPSPPSGA